MLPVLTDLQQASSRSLFPDDGHLTTHLFLFGIPFLTIQYNKIKV